MICAGAGTCPAEVSEGKHTPTVRALKRTGAHTHYTHRLCCLKVRGCFKLKAQTVLSFPLTICRKKKRFEDHLQYLVPGEDLAALADGPLRQDGAKVVVSRPSLQTDAQTARLAEALQLTHLRGRGGICGEGNNGREGLESNREEDISL